MKSPLVSILTAHTTRVVALFLSITAFSLGGFFVSIPVASATANVVITSPNSTNNIWRGTQDITWTDSLSASPYLIQYSSNFSVYTNLATSTLNSPYSWNTRGITDGVYKIKITSNTPEEGISGTFTIDNTIPTFYVNNGTDGGPVKTDTINVTVADATSGVNSTSLNYGFSNGTCGSSVSYATAFASGADFAIAGNHTDSLCVEATDNAGNTGYYKVGQLNTDNIAPTILSYTLDGGTTNAYFSPTLGNTMAIGITADEPVTWGTVRIVDVATGLEYKTKSPGSTGTTVAVTWDGLLTSPVLNDPASDGAYQLLYTITDLAGNTAGSLVGPLTPYQIIVDNTAPTMTSVVGTTVQGAGDTIVVDFSEPVTPVGGTWSKNDLTFESPIGTTLDTTNANFLYDTNNNKLTVTLNETSPDNEWLKTGGIVRAIPVTGAIVDRAGNALTASEDSVAITGDTTSPTVALTYDINRQVKDSDTVKITATFSEDMDNTPQIAIDTTGTDVSATNMTIGADRKVWTYDWNVPSSSDGTATVTITGNDLAGNANTSATNNTRVIDNTDPTMSVSSPIANEVVHNINGDVSFTFNATDTNLDKCSYEVGTGGFTDLADCTSPKTLTLNDGRQTVTLKATDKAGNSKTDSVDFVVDTDGILTVAKSGTPDFSTIQGAVGAWVTGITTISVADGTYAESGQIHITQDLTMVGTGVSKPIITLASALPATRNAAGAWILVDENITFTLENFVMDGSAFPTYVGVRSHGNTTITNVDFRNITASASGSPYSGMAVASFGGNIPGGFGSDTHNGTGMSPAHLIVTGSTFTNIGRVGITIKGDTSTSDITDNTYTGKGSGDWLDYAFELGAGGTSIIERNTISNNIGVAATDGSTSAGILATDYWGPGTAGTVTGNVFDNNTATIFVGYSSSDATVLTALYNTFNNTNAYGIKSTAPAVNGEMNWWGDATGPQNTTKNSTGAGIGVDDQVDFSPFCTDVPVYDSGLGTWSCTLVSVDPIASFDLNFNPTSQTVNNPSTLTVTAKDAGGVTVVNDTTTKMNIAGDNGSSFGSILLTMGALGTTGTTITNTITGPVNVTATEVGGSATGAGTIIFHAGSDVTAPVITNIQVTGIATSTATINWETDEGASSAVEYGLTSGYGGSTPPVTALTTNHAVTLAGLTSGTVYHFRVISIDGSSNVVTSTDNTFTTVGVDNTPPVITLLGQNPITLTKGDTFTDPGATANDNVDGNLTTNIAIDSSAVVTSVAGTYEVTYNVSDAAGNAAVTETRTVIVVDPAVASVTPVVSLDGPAILSSYTQSEATTRFADGLEFSTTNTVSFTVNGSSVAIATPVVAKTLTEASTLGLHVYNVVVTSSTGDTANITVSYEVTADFDDTASLGVTSVTASSTTAIADNTWENGWSWVFNVTVPTTETDFSMKFKDFKTSDGLSTIPAANNLRFYSVQSSDANSTSTARMITAAETYSDTITLDTDLDPTIPGRQIKVVVEMKVPTISTGGSYSSQYAVKSENI